jgi:salicylate hydroxylase
MGPANSGRRITVVGAGIGGLTTALAFARSGAAVTVLEQAQALTEVGAGVQITPNGMAVLTALGLGPEVAARSVRAAAICPSDAMTGRTLVRLDVSAKPYHFFYRPDVIDMLAKACAGAGVRVCTGFRVSTAPGVVDLGGAEEAPDLIIGADGIHSNLRPLLNGADAPFFTGQTAWRAIVPLAGVAPDVRIWMAPGRHVVTYPLCGDRLNIVAVREQAKWTPDGWNLPDAPAAMQAAFGECGSDLRAILAGVTETRLWGLFRHPVARRWHGTVGGRTVAILGDSAHPTLPFLAQGANLAIEDAWVLAAACAAGADLPAALARYQAARIPRVTRAIKAANANGRRFHLSGMARMATHLAIRTGALLAPGLMTKPLDWLYLHDVTTHPA